MRVPSHGKTCRLDYPWTDISDRCTQAANSAYTRIADALVPAPECLTSFWRSVYPALGIVPVIQASNRIRRICENAVRQMIILPDCPPWLSGNSYTREQCRRIRYITEVHYELEPILAATAAIALRWSESCESSSSYLQPVIMQQISHPLFRAIRSWPSCSESVTNYMKSVNENKEFMNTLGQARWAAWQAAKSAGSSLESPVSSSVAALSQIHACFEESCVVIVLISALRRAMILKEREQRHHLDAGLSR